MNGLGSGDLLAMAELELAERRRRASRERLIHIQGDGRQAGLTVRVVQALGRGLIRVGERLQGSSLKSDLTAEKELRLDRVPAS